MKVFSCKFDGYWPVGACAVIVAKNMVQASAMMTAQLARMGLSQDFKIVEVDAKTAGVTILLDGEY